MEERKRRRRKRRRSERERERRREIRKRRRRKRRRMKRNERFICDFTIRNNKLIEITLNRINFIYHQERKGRMKIIG
jgi:hypothetical protein